MVYIRVVALTVPFAEARRRLSELLSRVSANNEHVIITRNGEPEAVMLAPAEYESILETLDILSDPETMTALAESEEDLRAGRVVTFEEVKRKYGW